MKKVAIVGAGAAGLCCARHFGSCPDRFQVQMFEKGSELGGTWIYTESHELLDGSTQVDVRDCCGVGGPSSAAVHSSMYKNLRYAYGLCSLGARPSTMDSVVHGMYFLHNFNLLIHRLWRLISEG